MVTAPGKRESTVLFWILEFIEVEAMDPEDVFHSGREESSPKLYGTCKGLDSAERRAGDVSHFGVCWVALWRMSVVMPFIL